MFLSYGICDVVLLGLIQHLAHREIEICDDVTRNHQIVLTHKIRSTLGTVLSPTRVDVSSLPICASLEFNDGLVAISVEIIVNDGFGVIQTAA
jgi:hypothetical protein